MKRNACFALFLVCMLCLLLFVGCATTVTPPDLDARPQTSASYGTQATQDAPSSAADDVAEQKEPPAYWVGQTGTLPADLLPQTEPSTDTSSAESGAAGSGTATEPIAGTTTEPPHTTATTPNPTGGGRGDAYEVQGTNEYGVTVTIECTPFF